MPSSPPPDAVNPFNFVAFPGGKPARASGPSAGAHDRWGANRLCGVIEVAFHAVTPIFVPAGSPEKERSQPRPFWSCCRADSEEPVYGLPGTTVKGVFSALFEAFTRSRLRVFDESRYRRTVKSGKKKVKLEQLADPWRPREAPSLDDADTAEAALGFVSSNAGGHAFRGRLRFETFWLEPAPGEPSELVLAPLLSHDRTQLYFPRDGGQPRPRGRKIYWHQKWTSDFPSIHRGGDDDLDAKLQPLPAESVFAGRVHFDNLTRAELGAVLVSLCPDLLRSNDSQVVGFDATRDYGLKIGASKHADLSRLELLALPSTDLVVGDRTAGDT